MEIHNYGDFVKALLKSGFSMGGGSSSGIHSIINWAWREEPPYPTAVEWHTENIETDPWEWRIRVLNERDDIAYSKVFFGKSGFITRQWYPCFLAARRGNKDFYSCYEDSEISGAAKRIYEIIDREGAMPSHEIRRSAGFSKEEKAAFDRGITELQMKLFITLCGSAQKRNLMGEKYGWHSGVLCKTEDFWDKAVFQEAEGISKEEAFNKISDKISELNPQADGRRKTKFIFG